MHASDTIAAISSAVGGGARMIVRVSGPLVGDIHSSLIQQTEFVERSVSRRRLYFSEMIVPSSVYCFRAPRSATGEDVLELHIPGNPLLARMLLEELIRLGARQAEAGEFTARAYFNGRLSLTQAEGVAAAIAANSERELSAARQLLAGELACRLQPILDAIANTLALVEVGIDFSEEDVSFLSRGQISAHLTAAMTSLDELLSQSFRFERLSHEPAIVLVGRPNAGKSTLLNTLAEQDRAVVSDQAGTTRDILWAHARLPRGLVRIIDSAGLEEPGNEDEIAKSMQQHARRAIAEADLLVLVRDSTDASLPIRLPRAADLKVASKADLHGSVMEDELAISARAGLNMSELRDRLDHLAFGESPAGATLALNARHVQAIKEARESLDRATQRVSDSGAEVLALELRESLDALGGVLGMVTPDDVLGRIFSGFCIGK